jgi:DNA-directed RNA polymerase specialized sigma subunit
VKKEERYVQSLLNNVHEMRARQFNGVSSATDDLLDLADAIGKAGLTDRQKEVLRLLYIEDLTQAEAGERIGSSRVNITNINDVAIRKIASIYRKWKEAE